MDNFHADPLLGRNFLQLYEWGLQARHRCVLFPSRVDDSTLGDAALRRRLEQLDEFKQRFLVRRKLLMGCYRLPI